DGIRDILSCNVRRAAVNRLEQSDLRANTGRRQHADRPGQHRGFVAQNITEYVVAKHHIELPRVAHELHRRIVDIDVTQLYIPVILVDVGDHATPQLG